MRACWMIGWGALFAGCTQKNTDTTGETTDDAACSEATDDLSIEEVSPIGFSGQQILTLTAGSHDATLTWEDGSTAALALNVSYLEGDIRFIDREPTGGSISDTGLDGGLCPDTLEVDVSLSAVTDDDALGESWDVALVASEKTSASFQAEFDPFAMGGSYDISAALAGVTYDTVTGYATGAISAGGTSGVISAQATSTDDCADSSDCTTSAQQIAIGTWSD